MVAAATALAAAVALGDGVDGCRLSLKVGDDVVVAAPAF